MPGFFEEWVLAERQRLAEAYLQALYRLIQCLKDTGDASQALHWARRAVAADPLREESQQMLIRLLVAQGEREAARDQYQQFEQLLQSELGAPPAPETQALVERLDTEVRSPRRAILRRTALPCLQATPTPSNPSGYLPRQLTRFFGREPEIERLKEMLLDPEMPLVTLTGPGGTGKTRLAWQVAQPLREAFAGGVWFVSLLELTEPGLILDKLLQALRLPRSTGVEPLDQLVTFLSQRPGLLVLDNFEHLVEGGAELVGSLLEQVETLAVLVTSRQVLGLPGEREFPVAPLEVPGLGREGSPLAPALALAPALSLTALEQEQEQEQERLTALQQFPCVQLFVDRAQAVRPDFQLTPKNASAVAELCSRLEGLPLAIELAAARSGVLTPRQMVAQLDQRFVLLTSRQRVADPRHRNLRMTLDWSYQLLPPDLQQLLARLSVFRGGWTLEAAAAVFDPACGRDPVPSAIQQRAVEALEQLRDSSLVQAAEEAPGEIRYSLLETIREYARDQLVAYGEADATRRCHAHFFLRTAAAGPERFDVEHDNYRAALDWSLESGEAETGLRLGGALWWFWWGQGHWDEGRQRLQQLLTLKRAQERTAVRARALEVAGWLAKPQGDLAAARAFTDEALSIWRELDDTVGIAGCLVSLSQVARCRGDHHAAQALCQAALEMTQEIGDRVWQAHCLLNLGALAESQGEWKRAEEEWQEALNLYRELGLVSNIAEVLMGLGRIAQQREEYGRATTLIKESLVLYGSLPTPNKMPVVYGLVGLASISTIKGEPQRGARLYGAASKVLDELGSYGGVRLDLDSVRAALGEEAFAEAWAEGQALSLEQAIAEALRNEIPSGVG